MGVEPDKFIADAKEYDHLRDQLRENLDYLDDSMILLHLLCQRTRTLEERNFLVDNFNHFKKFTFDNLEETKLSFITKAGMYIIIRVL